MTLTDRILYTGRPINSKFYGKKTVNAVYVPISDYEIDPMNFDLKQEFNQILQEIGNFHLISGRKKKKIVGVGKNIVPVGFGSTFCFELFYVN